MSPFISLVHVLVTLPNVLLLSQPGAALTTYANTSSAISSSASPSLQRPNHTSSYDTAKLWVAETIDPSNYAFPALAITAQPNQSDEALRLSTALSCFSEIGSWKQNSVSFWNNQVANRTWPITSLYTSATDNFRTSSTIYPANVSTYKLCDGTPRANVRPITTTFNITTTVSGYATSTVTPTYTIPQPCSLNKQSGCRVLWDDTDAPVKADAIYDGECGMPAHAGEEPSCLVGGGPIELIYFPVASTNRSLCGNGTIGTTAMTATPVISGMPEITTLGRTFSSESVYMSFKTLYAYYDGFFDQVGPTFSDLIVPLHSTDISTQCGGWFSAYGAGTQMDYANLNWPVTASAYSCQKRCTSTYHRSATLAPFGEIVYQLIDDPIPPQCDTIWSDVNPNLAVPTKIREMVPEWSTCSFWNEVIANFWFDPPIALQPAAHEAVPTAASHPPVVLQSSADEALPIAPSHAETTAAFAGPTPASPTAPSTRAALPTAAAETLAAINSGKQTSTAQAARPSSGSEYGNPGVEPTADEETRTDSSTVPSTSEGNTPAIEPQYSQSPSLQPLIATAPAFSVLTEALATYVPKGSPTHVVPVGTHASNEPSDSRALQPSPTIGDIIASVIGMVPSSPRTTSHGAAIFSYEPSTDALTAAEDAPLTYASGDMTITITHEGGGAATVTIASDAIPTGSASVISEQTITHASQGLAVLPSALPESPTPTLLQAGSLTLSVQSIAASSPFGAVSVLGTVLTPGGPAITTDREIISQVSDGLVLIDPSTTRSFVAVLPIITSASKNDIEVLALGSLTITASSDPQNGNGLIINGTTLDINSGSVVLGDTTITAGDGALQIDGSTLSIISRASASPAMNSSPTPSGTSPFTARTAPASISPPHPTKTTSSTAISAAVTSRPSEWLYLISTILAFTTILLGR